MNRNARMKATRLSQIEGEFHALLVSCLRQCANGRWGLFGQNEHLPDVRWLSWPGAQRLKQLAQEIKTAHEEVGTGNNVCSRFLALCASRGPNVPGEPKLAATFLVEIDEE
jgi:hypothetical protein